MLNARFPMGPSAHAVRPPGCVREPPATAVRFSPEAPRVSPTHREGDTRVTLTGLMGLNQRPDRARLLDLMDRSQSNIWCRLDWTLTRSGMGIG